MNRLLILPWYCIAFLSFFALRIESTAFAQRLTPGEITVLKFPEVAPSLYTRMTGDEATPCLKFRLPDDFDTDKSFPLLVYVPGMYGGASGNIGNAQAIAGPKGWIVASLPLFKKAIDRSEYLGGVVVGFEDYATVSKAYQTMIGKLFELVPNIDRKKSAMVGFSNGAITIGVLVSNHDEFILTHFKKFCLVDHGMFHLADLHKKIPAIADI
jgi:hypothetical protein